MFLLSVTDCENQLKSLPSMGRETSAKKNERESLFECCFEIQRSKKPKQCNK